jgi:gluconate 2-dehydrogenase gamma chain
MQQCYKQRSVRLNMPNNFLKDRRRFILNSVMAAPAIAMFGLGDVYAKSETPQDSKPRDDYQPLFFGKEEWLFINSACDTLIPHDDNGPGALETQVPVFIDRQLFGDFGHAATWYMKGPFQPDAAPDRGYQLSLTPQQVYRLGIRETNDWCVANYQKSFQELSDEEKKFILEGLEERRITSTLVPLDTFFSFLLQNTKEGYFADPVHGGNKNMQSWVMIGYPGARASYLEWVEKHNVHYPLTPTSLNGKTV